MSSRPVPSMQPLNAVVLCGRLSSAPLERQLPSGSTLWSLEVSTEVAEGTLSVPVAWFDPPNAPTFEAGDEIVVVGTVRRRFFRTAAGTQSRTEVLAAEVAGVRSRRKVQRALQALATTLGAFG